MDTHSKKVTLATKFVFYFALLLSSSSFAKDRVKNVILFIGDGMGPPQIGIAMTYAKKAPNSVIPDRTLYLEKLMKERHVGLMTTWPFDALVNDSAGSGTQMSTGQPSRTGMIGVNADGNIAQNVIERARANGLSTGIVTTTRITHATPATFVAHNTKRTSESDIALDLVSSGVDVMMGGGLSMLLPQSVENKNSDAYKSLRKEIPSHLSLRTERKDDYNLISAARKNGYEFVFDRSSLRKTRAKKVIGVFSSSHLPDALTLRENSRSPNPASPKLNEMVEKAISILGENDKGFFMIVEGGQIDYACHYNDAGRLLHEMLQFDEAIGVAYEWAKNRDDTLILVTGDHETGGPAFFYANDEKPKPVALDGNAFKGSEYLAALNYGNPAILDRLYGQKSSIVTMIESFDSLPTEQKSSKKMTDIIYQATGYTVSQERADEIVQKSVKDTSFADVDDVRMFLISRELKNYYMISWASNTHSSIPLVVIASGPPEITNRFAYLMHDTEFGTMLNEVVSGISDAKVSISLKVKGTPAL